MKVLGSAMELFKLVEEAGSKLDKTLLKYAIVTRPMGKVPSTFIKT